jgi:hypothetical protein
MLYLTTVNIMEWGVGEEGCKEKFDIKLNFRMNKKHI